MARHRHWSQHLGAALGVSLLLGACAPDGSDWTAGTLQISVDDRGRVTRMVDTRSGRDYLADAVPSPILSVQLDGVLHAPVSFTWTGAGGAATLTYPGGVTAKLRVTTKPTHVVLDVMEVNPVEAVELVVWGPYATVIGDTIGETVGVVRDPEFAIGIQALNPKTLGGLPWRDNDFPPQIDLFESGDYSDLSEEGKRYVLYRVEAAKPETFGSTLQAYTRDRSRDRVIANWNHDRYVAPQYDDGGVVGSKIALFGSPTAALLETIGAIEVEEGLPHPTIDGEWGKTAESASAAYLILDFSEATINEAVTWTRRAGLRYLYHPEPFRTWGHFELNDRFPRGRAGMRAAVQTAEAAGIMVGVHTLSNFITTNDAYVTPVPDPRLARVGASVLTADVDARQTEVPIHAPDFFAQYRNNTLLTAVAGHELIQYRAVSEEEPWRLLDAVRGAFGTTASAHGAGDSIALLADHGYRVFLTDADLGREMATTIAELFNETGLRQISFDGVEGNQSTAMGNYGEILFTSTWYDQLSDDIKGHYIADASRTSHYFWHIYTRMNWGEPWYAGFRESQTEYRLKNQPYFRRNLMPGMLGWFKMTTETTIEDVEWMLARSAAFDAGYAFVTSFDALEGNGFTDRILDAIGMWERARMAGAFSAEQQRAMEDPSREFHLSANGEEWDLTEVFPHILRAEPGARQPGAPREDALAFDNPGTPQPLHWILSAEGGDVANGRLTLDDRAILGTPVTLREGWSLRYEGGATATIRNADHGVTGTVPVDAGALRAASGRHTMTLACARDARDAGTARLEARPESGRVGA
jgi:hypothetical protein